MLDTYMCGVKLYSMYKVQPMSRCHMEKHAISPYVALVYSVVLDSSPVDMWTIGWARSLDYAQNSDAKPYPREDQ